MGAFGEKLRKQREQRGIALETISNTTKISTRMLRALEDEHFDQLPGGVFNKGFVRAYARQVGLDEEEAIADYLAALRESQIQAQAILPDFRAAGRGPLEPMPPSQERTLKHDPREQGRAEPVVTDDGNHHRSPGVQRPDRRKQNRRDQDRSSSDRGPDRGGDRPVQARSDEGRRSADASPSVDSAIPAAVVIHEQEAGEPSASIPWRKLGAALLLVAAGLAFWNLYHRQQTVSTPPVAAASNSSPSGNVAPAAATESDASVDSRQPAQPLHPSAVPAATTARMPAASTPPVSKPAAGKGVAAAAPTSSPASPLTAVAAAPPTGRVVPRAAPAKPPATFTLLVRAEKTSWVSIIADGNPVAEETLIAPAHTSVRASHEIVVKAGNAAGISFLLNGKEIPAQGNDGEVRTYSFDGTSVQVVPQTQPAAANR